ncbi:MAG: hypothetical protein EA426_18065 [Spirochaetaceae bacterium]|nr:MAG: hypothetical protein EA426_18065 [Spirochaetaceae bacterium]
MSQIKPVPVCEYDGSSMFSWNGTCPESPDGTRVCYTRIERPGESESVPHAAELWICDKRVSDGTTTFGNHRRVFNLTFHAEGYKHNGSMASWVDERTVVFRHDAADGTAAEVGREFISVIDVETGKVLHGPIAGDLGHYACRGKIPFSVHEHDLSFNAAYRAITTAGIYELEFRTGAIRLVISTDDIVRFIASQNATPTERSRDIMHVMYNPSATRVMVRIDAQEYETIVSTDLHGGDPVLTPKKPLHQLWYDDDTYMAVDRHDSGNIFRYARSGEKLELLAGPGNHIAASPDRSLYVTDNLYHRTPVVVKVYEKGSLEPVYVLDQNPNDAPIWKLRAHANPVFSRDGRGVYFVRAGESSRVEAVFAAIG